MSSFLKNVLTPGIVVATAWLVGPAAGAQTGSPEFPPVPRAPAATPTATTPAGEVPSLNNLLRQVPLSIKAPAIIVTEPGQEKAVAETRAFAPLPQGRIDAGGTSIAQVLGSTANGTITKAYTITHLRAAEVQALLADPNTPLLAREVSSVMADARSNTLLVKGTEAEHQLVENLIRRVDVPVKQVLIEVKIISADEFFGQSLGARFGVTSSHLLNAAQPRNSGAQVSSSAGELSTIATTGTSTFPNMVSLPATNSLTSAPVSSLALGFYKLPAGIDINLEISALEEAGHTRVLSSPKLVLSNFKAGILSSGQRIPYSRPSIVQGVNTTEFIDAKVSVAVTPMVAPDGAISMDLTLTDDSVGSTSAIGPTINTNQVTSNITLKNGETLVLGGFQSSTQSDEANKTPWFGDLPILGHLFKNRSQSSLRRELLFIITPTVIGELQ